MVMKKSDRIVIVGAGVFGLTTACQLAFEGYENVTVIDRNMPPVPDGSSVDISRVIRFDYGDDAYLRLAYDAYQKWSKMPKYHNIFFPSPFILTSNSDRPFGRSYIEKCTAALDERGFRWKRLENARETKQMYPTLSGPLAAPGFFGYTNVQAGWADAHKALSQLRDDCIELGVSFISGRAGTAIGFEANSDGQIYAVRTLAANQIKGDHFILAAGAWASSLAPFYNSTLSTAQVVGYMELTDDETERLKHLPICINFSTGWFNFPPHKETRMLKMAIHGWGYTRSPSTEEKALLNADVSNPPLKAPRERANFVPRDGEERLREGLAEILPELADRPFQRVALCWYTDTPSGDFIMDYHPDYKNLFVAGGGSGHAFKFLPVLGEYVSLGLKGLLPADLAEKWRFREEFKGDSNAFEGDGSRGGPERRELRPDEVKSRL
ncbi:FAD dependent oxidoreductase [Ilyonectria sp. MPI-CAGE-AT-0026]|nr:FAD dependent oxidoreductase [Ilyonectria sp. MPI-CAGE-AT-0026]